MCKLIPSIALALLVAVVGAAPAYGQEFSPWSEPLRIDGSVNTSTSQQRFPFIAKNDLDLYFASNEPSLENTQGNWDIYVSHRDSVEDPWEAPINLGDQINTEYNEETSFVTIDGHWLYFSSNRPGDDACGGVDLWVSHRKDKRDDTGWETPVNLGCMVVNSEYWDTGPVIFENETSGQTFLYFSSNRPGGVGNMDLYVSTMDGDDKESFQPPFPVAEFNTEYNEVFPFVRRKDGLEIIFTSNRRNGWGDLYSSTRPDTSSPWFPPVDLDEEINDVWVEPPLEPWNWNDAKPAISWDGTALYFWRFFPCPTCPVGPMDSDIYVSTREKLKGID